MPNADSRKNKTCIVCRKRIESTVVPWSMVNITGDVVYWHPVCDSANSEVDLEYEVASRGNRE